MDESYNSASKSYIEKRKNWEQEKTIAKSNRNNNCFQVREEKINIHIKDQSSPAKEHYNDVGSEELTWLKQKNYIIPSKVHAGGNNQVQYFAHSTQNQRGRIYQKQLH